MVKERKLLKSVRASKIKELLDEEKKYLDIIPKELFGTAIVNAIVAGCIPRIYKTSVF
jgi:hypothetical protein